MRPRKQITRAFQKGSSISTRILAKNTTSSHPESCLFKTRSLRTRLTRPSTKCKTRRSPRSKCSGLVPSPRSNSQSQCRDSSSTSLPSRPLQSQSTSLWLKWARNPQTETWASATTPPEPKTYILKATTFQNQTLLVAVETPSSWSHKPRQLTLITAISPDLTRPSCSNWWPKK